MREPKIVIFDGVCNFCNGAVNFIIRRDPGAMFRFAPMQSEIAQTLMKRHNMTDLGNDTFILIDDDICRLRTDAALAIAAELTWPWTLCKAFRVLPTQFRDYFYDLFARKRYSLFGKRDKCMIPTDDVRSRFIGEYDK